MYIALTSFSGAISMAKGEIKDIKDEYIINDLINAKYIQEYVEEEPQKEVIQKKVEKTEVKKVEKKTNRKKK